MRFGTVDAEAKPSNDRVIAWGKDDATTHSRVGRPVGDDLVVAQLGRAGHKDDLYRRLGLTALYSLEEHP